MLCQRCRTRESTGILVHLCDQCFDEWEAEVAADPKSADLEPIDLACKHQSIGGLVPDHVDGVEVRRTPDGDAKVSW